MRYMYRGICIVNYDEEKQQVDFPFDEFQNGNIANVRLLPEDMELLAQFFQNVKLHLDGDPAANLEDIIV